MLFRSGILAAAVLCTFAVASAQTKKARAATPDSAELLMARCESASERRLYDEAVACYTDVLELRRSLFDDTHELVLRTYIALVWTFEAKGERTEARRTIEAAMAPLEKAGAAKMAEHAWLIDESAELYEMQSDQSAADREYDRAIAAREDVWKPSDPRFVEALASIADRRAERKAFAYAERLYRRIIEIQRKAHGERGEPYFRALTGIGGLFQKQERWSEAEAAFTEALAIRDRAGKRDLDAAECLSEIARARMGRRAFVEAVEAASRSIAIRSKLVKASDYRLLDTYALLAEAQLEADDYDGADASFDIYARETGTNSAYWLARTAERLGERYQARGEPARAAEKLEIAVANYDAVNLGTPEHVATMVRLAKVYEELGRTDEANRLTLRAGGIMWRDLFRQDGARGFLAVILVTFVVLAAAGTLVFGIVYRISSRRLNRRVAALYEPAPVEREPEKELVLAVAAEQGAPTSVTTVEQISDAAPPQEIAVMRLAFHGDGSTLFFIRVMNLLLALITAGVYSFWGKAKVRRYIYGQTELDGDRLVFHGNGRELLLGWLKGLPIIAFIIFFPNLLPLVWQTSKGLAVAQISAVAALLVLWPVAVAGAYRYRLNRMSWRGIRFSFRGSTGRFLRLYLMGYLLTPLTLGLYWPYFDVRARQLLCDHTYFGDGAFRLSARGRDLLATYLCAVPLTFLTLGLFWPWWSALKQRYLWAHTTFGDARFRCTATGGGLLRLRLGNLLLFVGTMGLAGSWATARSARFWTRHITLDGNPQLFLVRQDVRTVTATGESFADFLGFDFGI